MADWKEKAKSVVDQRDAGLAKVQPALKSLPDTLPLSSQKLPSEYLTEREVELTEKYDPVALLKAIRGKNVTCEEVTKAFLRRAALAQYATNCVTELLWDEAIARAKHLDSLPEPAGPLHGLPISVKEYHSLRGHPTHGSYVAYIGSHSNVNPINDILYEAGCIYYVRTTGPQALMHLETVNNIFGRTVNPYNRDLTSGGSSGGEGALVGFRGSCLGIGGDIGGSVRGPAADCGVYGFKPTTKRIPPQGTKNPMVGRDTIAATMGPLTTSREAIHLFMKTILDTEPWRVDPMLTPLPWKPHTYDRLLKIAVMWHDNVVRPHPPTTRALNAVVDACKSAGHTIIDWQPLDHAKAWDITARLYWPDAGKRVLDLIHSAGEPVQPLTQWVIDESRIKEPLGQHEYWALLAERDDYRMAYAAHWNKTATGKNGEGEVDVILCPATPGVAPLHETSKYWPYTSQWNLLDYPGVVFPTGLYVDEKLDPKIEGESPLSEKDKWNWDLYAPEKYVGAPISLQVVGRRNEDEKVMAALEVIENAMGRSGKI